MYNDITVNPHAKIIYNKKEYDSEQINAMIESIAEQINISNGTIAIAMSRNQYLIPALLTCLKMHIPYTILNPEWPLKRINTILSDSNVSAIITENDYKKLFDNSKCIFTDSINSVCKSNTCKTAGNSDIGYILYTSGTTNKPKGVEIRRDSIINFIAGMREIFNFKSTDKIGCLTTQTFDIFFLESVMPVNIGMTVVLADDNTIKNPKHICNWLVENDISIIQSTPSRLQQIILVDKTLKCMNNVKYILVGGEKLPDDLLQTLQKYTDARIFNMYGPTETTIWSSVGELTRSSKVSIGKPIKNTEFYILSENMDEVPENQVGQIYISGAGLAKGYRNLDEKTKENFIYLKNGTRVYKTGDLGLKTEEGTYECHGRIDNQIKILGHRIELEEIENTICLYKNVHGAVAFIDNTNEFSSLNAYVLSDGELDTNDLKRFLYSEIPDYMVPSCISQIKEFPLNPAGKVDRKKLYECFLQQHKKTSCEKFSENSKVRDTIIHIICSALNMSSSQFNTSKNLSDLGTNSLSYVRIIVEIEKIYDIEFDDEMNVFTDNVTAENLISYTENKIKNNP